MSYRYITPHEAQRPLYLEELAELERAIERYEAGELDEDTFRRIRLSYGVYLQLPHVGYMTRVKRPAGRVSSEQLRALSAIADRYAHSELHVTTRQDIQFHWIPLREVPRLYRELFELGINNRGACMDGARNVKCDPLAGLATDEPFDVTPYALAVTDFYFYHPDNLKLPRKYKISFSATPADRGQVFIDCLGFVATTDAAGRPGFQVLAGGGLGSQPVAPIEVLPFLPAEEVLYAADAAIRFFRAEGNYRNRNKARLKYVLQRLGPEGFRTAFQRFLEAARLRYGDALRTETERYVADFSEPSPVLPAGTQLGTPGPGFEAWRRTNVVAQKQAGYAAVTVKLPLGDMQGFQARTIAALADRYGNGTLRLTGTQKLLIPFVPEGALPAVHATLVRIGLGEAGAGLISDVVSCPGADYCSLAVAKSRGVGVRIRELLRGSGIDEADLGPFEIKISGCPNSCGQHHVADVGLTGMMLKDAAGHDAPHWGIFVGGHVGGLAGRHGFRLRRRIPENLAPLVIVRFVEAYLAEREPGERFADFAHRQGRAYFERLADEVVAPEAALKLVS